MHTLISRHLLIRTLPIWLICITCLIIFWFPSLNQSLYFDRELVAQGQWYRLISANLVHNNIHHLWLNLIGAVIIYLLFAEHFHKGILSIVCLVSALSVSIGLYFFDALDIYLGLSGVLHGIFTFGVLLDLASRRKSAYILAIGGIIKLAYEQMADAEQQTLGLIDIAVAVNAHLYGSVGGLCVGIIYLIYRKGKVASSSTHKATKP